jgi:hypothetical protein
MLLCLANQSFCLVTVFTVVIHPVFEGPIEYISTRLVAYTSYIRAALWLIASLDFLYPASMCNQTIFY